jgi:hypothetical protein
VGERVGKSLETGQVRTQKYFQLVLPVKMAREKPEQELLRRTMATVEATHLLDRLTEGVVESHLLTTRQQDLLPQIANLRLAENPTLD